MKRGFEILLEFFYANFFFTPMSGGDGADLQMSDPVEKFRRMVKKVLVVGTCCFPELEWGKS